MNTLENICLDLIVQHFEQFYFAFTLSKDKKQMQNFVVLQKRFSDTLVEKIFSDKGFTPYNYFDAQACIDASNRRSFRNGKLIDAYFDFLINEHLAFLDCEWFNNSCYLKSMENIFCRLPNLTRIKFKFCGDEILRNIAIFCPKIVEIDATFSDVTDNGIKYLYELKNGVVPCPELKEIVMLQCFITDKGAECLIRNLPSIKKFEYPKLPLVLYSFHKENLCQRKKVHFYNLVELDVYEYSGESYFNDLIETCLFLCPKLESMWCQLSDEEQLCLFANKNWKELNLEFSCQNININNFIKVSGSHLTKLSISNCTVSISTLSVYCPILKELSINSVNITDNDNLKAFFPCLTILDLSENGSQTMKSFCSALLSSPKLECMRLSSCILDVEMEQQILMWCRSPFAKEIKFKELHLEINFLRDILLNGSSLETLIISHYEFDDVDADVILQDIAQNLPNKPRIRFSYPPLGWW